MSEVTIGNNRFILSARSGNKKLILELMEMIIDECVKKNSDLFVQYMLKDVTNVKDISLGDKNYYNYFDMAKKWDYNIKNNVIVKVNKNGNDD
jgi:hypothetical protein